MMRGKRSEAIGSSATGLASWKERSAGLRARWRVVRCRKLEAVSELRRTLRQEAKIAS